VGKPVLREFTVNHEKTLLSRPVETAEAFIDKRVYWLTVEKIAPLEGTAKGFSIAE